MPRSPMMLTAALLAVTATATTAHHALAAPSDRKDLPGMSCQMGYNEGQVSYYHDGKFYNDSSTGWRTALCPLVMDREWRGHTLSIGLSMRVTDRSYDKDITCRMMTGYNDWVNWGAAASSSGSDTNGRDLSVADIGGGIAVWALCYVPPTYAGQRSSIDAFSWTEYETTHF